MTTPNKELSRHSNSLQMYEQGISRKKNGNKWIITGACISAGGAIIAAMQPFEWRYEYVENGHQYYKHRDKELNNMIGWGVIAAGGATMLTGVILRTSGGNLIKKSYSKGKSKVVMELKFDFTGNGAYLALQF